MSDPKPANSARKQAWVLGLAVILPLLAMSLRGVDASWDLRNYHLYGPHAWLFGRTAIDIAPAQLQSFHNPLLDLPLYLIVHSGAGARWASAWLSLPCMASIYLLLRLQRTASPATPTPMSQAVLALLALTGAAMYSTLALSTNDAFVAAAALGSLLLVVEGDGSALRRWFFSGLLMGAMTGLKLTAGIYCIGLAAAALVQPGWHERAVRVVQLALGGLLGFLATYGYWGWRLFSEHGNPFFPYYNNVFHSPDAAPLAWADPRFQPASLPDALMAPVHLLSRSTLYSELRLRDPRVLLGLLGLAALVLLARKQAPRLRNKFGLLLAFFVTSFVVWILQYGIYRYAIALELLGSLALVLLLDRLPRWRFPALALAVLLVSADTRRPDWGHTRNVVSMAGIHAPALGGGALVLIASGEPLAYLALGLPDSVPLIGVNNNFMSPASDTRLQRRAGQVIASHVGPIWLLTAEGRSENEARQVLTRAYGLETAGPCVPFPNSLAPARLCPQRRSARALP